MDVEGLDSGEFGPRLLDEISSRVHFVVVLQRGSLDGIADHRDWLRREVAHALTNSRNVVPIAFDRFEFDRDIELPVDVARLPAYNAVALFPEYYEAGVEKLHQRFLRTPPPGGGS